MQLISELRIDWRFRAAARMRWILLQVHCKGYTFLKKKLKVSFQRNADQVRQKIEYDVSR